MVMSFTKSVFAFKEGKTVLAEINIDEFGSDKEETVDEAVLRALRALQRQLTGKISDELADGAIRTAVPYVSDLLRPKKTRTCGYRVLTYPH